MGDTLELTWCEVCFLVLSIFNIAPLLHPNPLSLFGENPAHHYLHKMLS